MARQKGAKCVPKDKARTIYEMSCVGVRVCQIAAYYNMARPTVSNIIRRLRNASTKPKRKKGPRRKLSERGMRLFQKYVLEYTFDPLYVILGRFKETTGMVLSQQTGRRYIREGTTGWGSGCVYR